MENHLCWLPSAKTNTCSGTRDTGFTLQLSHWFLMKQNICAQELFSSNAFTLLSKTKIKSLSFLTYRNIHWANYALGGTVTTCHFLPLITNARCLEVKSASCSRRGQCGKGKEGDKGSGQEKTQSGFGLPVQQVPKTVFVVIQEEVRMTLKSLRNKFSLKPLSSPMIFLKPHSCIILVLWQRRLTLSIQ